jgi:S-DNA-T family DNA segregation ATPase FtsK/SpoIIIE
MATAVQKRRSVTRVKSQKSAKIEGARPPELLRPREWVRDTVSIILLAVGLFILFSLGSHGYQLAIGGLADPSSNVMGRAGHVVATILFGGLGLTAILPVVGLIWLAFFRTGASLEKPKIYPNGAVLAAFVGMVLSASILIAIFLGATFSGSVGHVALHRLGGVIGVGGAAVLTALLFLVCSAVASHRSIGDVAVGIRWLGQSAFVVLGVRLPLLVARGGLILAGMVWSVVRLFSSWFARLFVLRAPVEVEEDVREVVAAPKPKVRKNSIADGGGFVLDKDASKGQAASEVEPVLQVMPERAEPIIVKPKPRDMTSVKSLRPDLDGKPKSDAAKGKGDSDAAGPEVHLFEEYEAPSVSLLTREEAQQLGDDDDELRQKAEQIESKLRDFNIAGRVTQVHPGPVITLFEFEPAAGVKVGRIAALQDDLAMSLKASSIRIIAPLPKRGTVGIEVPNKHRAIVRLRDCLESQALASADSILSVPLGKDTYGDAVVVDIATMPHLLMAGATGTGKSVCINALLLSLLYRAHPSELGLILIDPKVLELSIYDGIPHLRVPVVTDPRQAKGVLSWAVKEMDRRYRYMQRFGVRNIDGYNRVVRGQSPDDSDEPPISASAVQMQMFGEKAAEQPGADSSSVEKQPLESVAPEQLKPLPKLVIVIDELADLMLSVGREIEELITRLAQKARAAGIHLIVATQRPSVDVITGLIKANFPARLSFRVSSRIDSRTILDSMGAEKLLGKGDMLFMLPGAVPLKRVHGAFISDQEVQKVVSALKSHCPPQYDDAIIAACDKAMSESTGTENGGEPGSGEGDEDFDPFYDKAVELVVEKGQASTSMIQRTFRIGYNRAARIIEMMEREGVVSKMDGVRPREVLAPARSPET